MGPMGFTMATRALGTTLQQLRRSFLRRDGEELTDGELLECYVTQREAAAFEALVRRHGPMVLGVCRRILRSDADAEDAFQATFLVLVRKAASIRPRGMVGNWLYGVAHKAALKAKAMIHKRREKERQAAALARPEAPEEVWQELQPLLDAEMSRLPDKYRVPIVLCDLEGQTIKEAARHLGWPQGTVGTRLARGRALLARRLSRHGLALSAGALAAVLTQNTATAALSPVLLLNTSQAAGLFAAGPAAAGAIAPSVAALTEGVLKAMLLTRLKVLAAILLMTGILGAGLGVGGLAYRAQAAPPEAPVQDKKVADAPKPPQRPAAAEPVQPAMLPLPHGKAAVTAVAFSPDGKHVATGCADKTVRLWDLSTGRETMKQTTTGEPTGVAFSADGGRLVFASADGIVTACDATSGRVIWKFKADQQGVGALATSPDGTRVAVGTGGAMMVLHLPTGKVLLKALGHTAAISGIAFSPGGKMLATAGKDGQCGIWEGATGAQVLRMKSAAFNAVAFSPDGRSIALAEDKGLRVFEVATGKFYLFISEAFYMDKGLRVFEVATGKEMLHQATRDRVRAIAYAPDGKTLATAGDDRMVRLWNAKSGKEVWQFGDVQGKLRALVFARDGKRIVTAGENGTAVVWDLTRDEKPLPKGLKLTAKELDALWADLADDGKSYVAARMLRADPERSLPFLKERLKPRGPGADEKKIKQLIADLDADEFAKREKAMAELRRLGKETEPALREALAGGPSAEARARLGKLLAALGEPAALTPAQERDVRAVRVLEQVGTPEARKLLEALVKESPGWWVTQEAKEALGRLPK